VWQRLLRYHHVTQAVLDKDLQDRTSLRLEDYDVLFQLTASGGKLRMNDLAQRVLVTRSSCTRLVDRLVERGLVERRASVTDRRSVEVATTSAGRAALRRAAPTHLNGISRLFASRLGSGELAQLVAILERLEQCGEIAQ
jgi:DNA-binding MarR family transcriptional regulator